MNCFTGTLAEHKPTKIIKQYETEIEGQRVTVTVYEPAVPEWMRERERRREEIETVNECPWEEEL